ncbi:MAG: RAMP superfamily CRISPR-associated protein [Bacteroidales bacterium]|jgi:CRISPR-associated protein Cmr2
MLEVGKKKKEIMGKLNDHQDYNFYPTNSDLKNLPEDSTLLKISFTLKKPYTSKDEGEFNVIDNKIFENPIVRDKFTGLPMVKPTTWKGHLRFAAERVECDKERKKIIIKRLFGSEPEEKENPLKGRLYFFPTFFNEDAEKDVITPLKRDTRTPASGPIPFEVMKPGKKGEFYLLYIPYPKGNDFNEEEIIKDLTFLVKALELMFYTYGFSAKKTSGFGVIEESLEKGEILIKMNDEIQIKEFSKLDELKNEINKLERKP